MPSRLRRAISPALAAAALAAALFMSHPLPAEAAGCPTTPVSEHGGKHWCYKDGDHGNVHLWKPDSYNNQGAITVVYIHGLDTGKNGPDTCKTKRPYVDCIWDASDWNIVQQFASSGVNALFVAVEGQLLSAKTESVRWSTLSSLITSITDKGKFAPPTSVTVAGHSAGMYTARALWKDARVKHVISLDWVDGSLEDAVSSWYKKGGGRELTLIGGSGQQKIMDRMKTDLPCTKAANASSLTEAEISAPCLYLRTDVGHMRVVLDKKYLPAAIGRSSDIATSGGGGATTPPPAAGPTTVVTRQPVTPTEYLGPRLEIPIPGIEFSNIIREDSVTIPWMAQYVGGAYTFLISIVGLLAAVMIVIAGFQYVTAAGDKQRIGAARKRILNAVSGLVLALGSYTILYAVNPDLVAFDGLKLTSVGTELYSADFVNATDEGGLISASEDSSEGVVAGSGEFPDLGSAGRPQPICTRTGGGGVMKCSELCAMKSISSSTAVDDETGKSYTISPLWPTKTDGMADPKNIVPIPGGLPGVTGKRSTDRMTLELLKKAGEIASSTTELEKIGVTGGPYVLRVTSAYRPLFVQIAFACDKDNGTGDAIGSTLANPGGSLHGAGFALDMLLETPSGADASHCSGCSKKQQLNQYRKGAINIAKIMFAAGFRRVNNEIWHFEPANAPKPSCRCMKFEDCTYPARRGSAWLSAYEKVNDALAADPKNAELKAAWGKITDVKYGGGTVNVNGTAISVPASPVGCGKKSNYENGAL